MDVIGRRMMVKMVLFKINLAKIQAQFITLKFGEICVLKGYTLRPSPGSNRNLKYLKGSGVTNALLETYLEVHSVH